MERPPKIQKRTSSGGVIYRRLDSMTEIALVLIHDRNIWCLPKGTIDQGESPPEAAHREVQEESGLNGRIIDKLGSISYWYFVKNDRVKVHKTVHFYLMEYLSGSTDDHDHEVEESRWFPIDEALGVLTHKSERDIVRKAKSRIEQLLK